MHLNFTLTLFVNLVQPSSNFIYTFIENVTAGQKATTHKKKESITFVICLSIDSNFGNNPSKWVGHEFRARFNTEMLSTNGEALTVLTPLEEPWNGIIVKTAYQLWKCWKMAYDHEFTRRAVRLIFQNSKVLEWG